MEAIDDNFGAKPSDERYVVVVVVVVVEVVGVVVG